MDHILVIDDGSTDASALRAREHGATVLTLEGRRGVGFALRTGLNELREKFDIIVIMAGNTKDDPAHIGRLIDPIVRDGYDVVIGSRFLPGGCYGGETDFDSTVQEANIAYPADANLMTKLAGLRRKVVEHLRKKTRGFLPKILTVDMKAVKGLAPSWGFGRTWWAARWQWRCRRWSSWRLLLWNSKRRSGGTNPSINCVNTSGGGGGGGSIGGALGLGSGTTPGAASDPDRGTAGKGGAGGASGYLPGQTGNPGKVVISY